MSITVPIEMNQQIHEGGGGTKTGMHKYILTHKRAAQIVRKAGRSGRGQKRGGEEGGLPMSNTDLNVTWKSVYKTWREISSTLRIMHSDKTDANLKAQ